ncbi:MAG: insulinase family protein [Polyangiaceae bacterium]|nr:insulinase family protein [Polyangiaceae bacterium]
MAFLASSLFENLSLAPTLSPANRTMNPLRITAQLCFLLACASLPMACQSPPPTNAVDAKNVEQPPVKDARYISLPEPGPRPEWAPPEIQRVKITEELTLWHLQRHGAPLVSVHLILNQGAASDPEGQAGLTALTIDMLDEGVTGLTSLELSDEFGQLGTDYSARTGLDYSLLSLNALAENTPRSLELLAKVVLSPEFPPAEFQRRKKHHLAQAMSRKDQPQSAMNIAVAASLFGKGYAGRPIEGTTSSLKILTIDSVRAHAKELLAADSAQLVIVGDIQLEKAQALAQQFFGTWHGKRQELKTSIQSPVMHPEAIIVDYPGAPQSALAVVRRAGDVHSPQYYAESVMNERLGGMFTSRINLNLREDKGYTYGATSFFQRYRQAGYLGIFSQVRTETTGPSIDEIFREIQGLCAQSPLTDAERNEAVEGLLLGFPLKFERLDQLGLRIASLPIYERPVDFWFTWPAEIAAITTEKSRAAIEPYCDLQGYQVVVAGDAKTILPQLEKLGLKTSMMSPEGERLSPQKKEDSPIPPQPLAN